jgi:hypothetical protein
VTAVLSTLFGELHVCIEIGRAFAHHGRDTMAMPNALQRAWEKGVAHANAHEDNDKEGRPSHVFFGFFV